MRDERIDWIDCMILIILLQALFRGRHPDVSRLERHDEPAGPPPGRGGADGVRGAGLQGKTEGGAAPGERFETRGRPGDRGKRKIVLMSFF